MPRQRVEDRIEKTARGINYIIVSPSECYSWGGACICNFCGRVKIDKPLYMCYIMHDLYCEDCFKELTENSTLTDEDLAMDLKQQDEYSLEWYKAYLGD